MPSIKDMKACKSKIPSEVRAVSVSHFRTTSKLVILWMLAEKQELQQPDCSSLLLRACCVHSQSHLFDSLCWYCFAKITLIKLLHVHATHEHLHDDSTEKTLGAVMLKFCKKNCCGLFFLLMPLFAKAEQKTCSEFSGQLNIFSTVDKNKTETEKIRKSRLLFWFILVLLLLLVL